MGTTDSPVRSGEAPPGVDTGQLRPLGRTGVLVNSLCLGGMGFGAWANRDHGDCARIIHAALDAGINMIDTADVYSYGESETIIGSAIASRRSDVILATKFSAQIGGDPNHRGTSRLWIMRAVEASLRRLGTDYIDLYQMHRSDPHTDLGETIDALTDLVRSGKIRYFGSSTARPHEVVRAQWLSERRGSGRFICEQPPYSMLVRRVEAELLPVAQQYEMGVVCWSPLAGGWLSGGFHVRSGATDNDARRERAGRMPARFDLSSAGNQAKLRAVEALAALADDAGLTLAQMGIAFVLEHPAVTSAIIGPRTLEQLSSIVPAMTLRLDEDVLDRIDEIVSPGMTINPADDDHLAPIGLRDPRDRRRPR